MRGARIVVVSDNRPIRETVRVVLGGRSRVLGLDLAECRAQAASLDDASVIVTDAEPSLILQTIRAGNPSFARPILPLAASGSPRKGNQFPFDPEELRRRIERAQASAEQQPEPRRELGYPVIPRLVEAALPKLAASALPVLVLGEPGTGKFRLARALHALRGDHFVTLQASLFERVRLANALIGADGAATTVYLDEVEALTADGLAFLRELIVDGGLSVRGTWIPIRLVAATCQDYDELRERFHSIPNVLPQLSGALVRLPPLRRRLADLPALVEHCLRATGTTGVAVAEDALRLMADYLWPGNYAELEAVVARSAIFARSPRLEAADVRLSADEPDEAESRPSPAAEEHKDAAGKSSDFDLLVTELAHEFKNPMVVIKTAAQHLDRVLEEDSGRKELARMAGEAVDRMDRALENLMQFSRFDVAEAQDIAVVELLASGLSNVSAELDEKKVVVDRQIPFDQLVHVDPLQLAHACENLLRAVLRDLPQAATMTLRPLLGRGGFAIELPLAKRRMSEHLVSASGGNARDGEPQVMGVRMAQDLVQRSGGRIVFANGDDKRIIEVELPSGGGVVEGDEETTRFDS